MAVPEELTLHGVRRLEPNRLGAGLSLAVAAVFLVGAVVALATSSVPAGREAASFWRLMGMPFVFGLIGGYWFGRLGKKPSKEAHDLRSTAGGLELGGERVLSRSDIRSALVWPTPHGGTVVRIDRGDALRGPLDLEVQSLEDGRALVRSLGHSGAQAARRFRIAAPSPLHHQRRVGIMWGGMALLTLVLILAGAFLPAAVMSIMGPAFAIGFVGLMGQLVKGGHVEVGTDGVHVSWLWQKTFIPMSDIVRAETNEGAIGFGSYYPITIRIHRRSGPPIDLLSQLGRSYFGQRDEWKHLSTMRADVVVERINEAVAARAPGAPADLATWESELLSRGQRPIQPWVTALRGLHTEVESFRKRAGGGIESLWGVLEDATAEPERRAAAAVALTPHLDGDGRDRVRIAARATAAPKLRIALEAAANDDEAALVAALEEVSGVAPAPTRRLEEPTPR